MVRCSTATDGLAHPLVLISVTLHYHGKGCPSRRGFRRLGIRADGITRFLASEAVQSAVRSPPQAPVLRKHSGENCSTTTVALQAPDRVSPDSRACSAVSGDAYVPSIRQSHRNAAARYGRLPKMRSITRPAADCWWHGSGREAFGRILGM